MFYIIPLRGDSMKKFYQLYIVRNEAGESTADNRAK